MKKALILLLTFALLFSLVSCRNHDEVVPESEQTVNNPTEAVGNESVSGDTAINLIADYYSETVDGLELSVSTPDVVCKGTMFRVIATVTNNTDRPLEYTYGCCGDTDPSHVGVVAEIGDGQHEFINLSALRRYFCDGLTVRTLEVGESISEEIEFIPAWSEADVQLLYDVFAREYGSGESVPTWNMPCIPYEEGSDDNGRVLYENESGVLDWLAYNFDCGVYNGKATFTAGTEDGYSRTVSLDFSVCIDEILLYEESQTEQNIVCSEPTAPANFGFLRPVQYTAQKDGLVLDVFAPAKVPKGQEFVVSAIITNTTDEPITYTLASCSPDMHLEIEVDIKDENGRWFIDTDTAGKCMADAMLEKTLAPGESFQEVIRFSPSWSNDLSMGLEYSELTPFEEGHYNGTAVFRWDNGEGGEEKSLSLTFPVEIIPMP